MYSSVQHVQSAIQALRKAATKGKTKKSVLESIDNVSSTTVLLNSSNPSIHAFDKLVTMLREPLIPLYASYTEHSLNFASAVLKVVLNDGVRPCLLEGDTRDVDRQAGWERVARALLSGVIDFLDKQDSDLENTKASIAKALFSPVCNFFFSKDNETNAKISANLRCIAYELLSNTATLQKANRDKLRDKKLLGGHALGMAISKTRDFSALEALLNLFGVVLPTCQGSKEEYDAFVQDVFSDQIDIFSSCRNRIANLLSSASRRDWDETATKVVNILSASNISFPQQFDVNEVIICGHEYPQPELSDMFYIDKTTFSVNIQQEDGLYEFLQIAYENVLEIKFASEKDRTTSTLLTLKSAPKVGDLTLPVKDEQYTLLVEILNNDIPRFKEALQHRDLHRKISGVQKTPKATPRVSVSGAAFLDFGEDAMPWEDASLIHSQKAKEVEGFYESEPPQAPTSDNEKLDVIEESISLSKGSVKASSAARSDEELSEIDNNTKATTSKAKAKATKAGKKITNARPAVKSIKGIALSDGESVAEFNPPRGRKGTRKGTQRRVESDEESTSEEPAAEPQEQSKKSAPKKAAPPSVKSSNTKTRPKAKPAAQKKSDENHELYNDIETGRLRRAAATTASAKIATTFIDSDDTNASTLHQVESLLLEKKPDADPLVEVAEVTEKISKKAGQTPKAAQSTTAIVDHEITASRSSSPTSKISRMKTKNVPVKTKPTKKKAQKRKADDAIAFEEDMKQPHKKTRAIVMDVLQDKAANEDDIAADRPRVDASAHPPKKYGHRGQKSKVSPTKQKSSIDWDQVPSETLGIDKTRQAEASSPKRASPIKTTAKKENSRMPKDVSKKVVTPNPGDAESKPRPLARAPLQTITQAPNQASTNSKPIISKPKDTLPANTALNKKLIDQQSTKATSTKAKAKAKESVLPSLEDILLKGAVVEKIEIEQTEMAEAKDEIMNNDGCNMDDVHSGNIEDGQTIPPMDVDDVPYTVELNIHERPHTPPQEKAQPEPPSSPHVSNSRHPKKVFDLDSDLMDLTDEDVKEVLQTLRARRAKGKLEFGKAPLLDDPVQEILATNIGRESSPLEANKAQEIQKMLSRPKVKFNEELRFKSASLETLSDQEAVAPHQNVEGRKPRLSGKLVARGLGSIETAGRSKKQESQIRKEPGMEDIVNVLDAIQNVIASNIANKSRAVRSDIRVARDRLIHEAVADLHEMEDESFSHYNNLFSLETEYANINRKLNIGFEAVTNVNSDICNFVRQTIGAHDRGSLSKKMSQSIFSSAIPPSFSKFL